MKQLTITRLIKDCNDCPYCNLFGRYCSLKKQSLPEIGEGEFENYDIPDWCNLDELEEYKDQSVYLVSCAINNDRECMGVSCIFSKNAVILPNKQIAFTCGRFPHLQKLIRS